MATPKSPSELVGREQIAAVVNLHAEGESATPSLVSSWRAIEFARARGRQVELAIVLDSADQQTVELADHWRRAYGATILTTEARDLGMARNHAASQLDAEWLAFLDGDDLWGEEWLVAAHSMASTTTAELPVVLHPQVNIIFGDHHSLLHHIDSTDPDFRWSRFHLHNAWTALSFVRREVIVELPYPPNDLENGFGFEDWAWNMAVLHSGGQHLVVPDTCHFIKRVDGPSLLGRSQHALRTPYQGSTGPGERPTGTGARDEGKTQSVVDAGTHIDAPVELSERILHQIGLAATIEPTVEETLTAHGTPSVLPQNFNVHNTAPQFALEELWTLRKSDASVASICERSSLLAELPADDRMLVVAEFLRTEVARGRSVGESTLVTEATERFSQLLFARDEPDHPR